MISLLLLPEQPDVSWARLSRDGEGGSFSYTIDASGTSIRNRMMHRELVPAPTDARIQIRIRFKSTLIATDNGYEGFAPRVRGFQLEGTAPTSNDRQIYDSNPSAQGRKMWFSSQQSEWTTRSFIIDIEESSSGAGVDYYTVELVVRAQSGSLTVTNIECQTLYSKEYKYTPITRFKTYNGAAFYLIKTYYDANRLIKRFMRDVETINCNVSKGKRLICDGLAVFLGAMQNPSTLDIHNTTTIIYLKMKIRGEGRYEYYELGRYTLPAENYIYRRQQEIKLVLDAVARSDYDQAILVISNSQLEGPVEVLDNTTSVISVWNLSNTLFVNDFVTPSQG